MHSVYGAADVCSYGVTFLPLGTRPSLLPYWRYLRSSIGVSFHPFLSGLLVLLPRIVSYFSEVLFNVCRPNTMLYCFRPVLLSGSCPLRATHSPSYSLLLHWMILALFRNCFVFDFIFWLSSFGVTLCFTRLGCILLSNVFTHRIVVIPHCHVQIAPRIFTFLPFNFSSSQSHKSSPAFYVISFPFGRFSFRGLSLYSPSEYMVSFTRLVGLLSPRRGGIHPHFLKRNLIVD